MADINNKNKSKPQGTVADEGTLPKKRPSPDGDKEAVENATVTKKKRVLPNNWGSAPDVMSQSSGFGADSVVAAGKRVAKVSSSGTLSLAANGLGSKPAAVAPVFLSKEQTKILKLVQEGQSVFYTGSAGMLLCSRQANKSC